MCFQQNVCLKSRNTLAKRVSGDFIFFARTTFAWFTTRDEVTNRLSASGDYDVSIVESFAPPANWLPGQEVNKDVYAVNTGSVAAFVKESLSGVLTITQEEAYTSARPDADSIKLSPAEVYVIEDGSYLAWAPTTSKFSKELGNKVVAMKPDFKDENGYTSLGDPDFAPDAEGLYVFRRVINYPSTDIDNYPEGKKTQLTDVGNEQIETFEYVAYYFVPGMSAVPAQYVGKDTDGGNEGKYKWVNKEDSTDVQWTDTQTAPTAAGKTYVPVYDDTVNDHDAISGTFYKVSNLSVTPDNNLDYAGDGINTDGILAGATAGFYKEVTETINPTGLKYEKAVTTGDNQHPNRLVITYKLGPNAKLETLAENYDKALRAFEDAIQEYKAAVGDLNGTTSKTPGTNPALTKATNDLQDALAALRQAANDKAEAEELVETTKKAMDDAQEALEKAQGDQADAQKAYDDAVAALENATLLDNAAQAKVTAKKTALGEKTDADDGTGTSKWADYNTAKKKRETAESTTVKQNFLNAFNAYVDDHSDAGVYVDGDTTGSKVTIDTVTYNQLEAMHLELNEDDDAYEYWQLVVAEKRAKEALDAAQAEYDNAVEEQKVTAQQKTDAETAKTKAKEVLDAANDAVGGTGSGATKEFNEAKQAWENAKEALGDETDDADDDEDASAWAKYNKAVEDLEAARVAYDTALAAANADKADLDAAEANYAAAAQALSEAEKAYNEAVAQNDGEINIYVNLSDKVTTATPDSNDLWQLVPSYIGTNAPQADFYYTGILDGGATTSMLVDSIELDKSVTQDMFKYLDFDLNVVLTSAQIAMDGDGQTILTTAADETITGAKATLANPKDEDTVVTWAAPAAATPSSYTAAAQSKTYDGDYADVPGDVTITRLATPQTVNGTTYTYQIVDSGKTYFGTGLTSGKIFKEVTATTDGEGVTTYAETVNGNTIKLSADATASA